MINYLNFFLKTCSMIFSLFSFAPDDLNLINNTDYANYDNVYVPEYINENPFEGQDNYEYNDNYDDAIKLCPDDFYNLNEYQTTLNATLYYNYLTPDHDYYYFTIFTDSYVEIQLNSLSLDCKFSLTYFDYVISSEDNDLIAESSFFLQVNNDGLECYRSFSGLLKPGTYIIYLDNLFDYAISIPYELTLCVSKSEDNPDIYINDLIFNKDLLGAIWMNDYIPFNFNPNLSNLSDVLYYDFNKQNLNYYDYSLGKLSSLVGDEAIKSCVIYIWDPALRITLYEILVSVAEIIEQYLNNNERLAFKLQLEHDYAENTIRIIGLANEIFTINKKVKKSIEIGLESLSNTLDVIFQLLMPKIELNKIEYFAYINSLISALDMCYDADNLLPDVEVLRRMNALEIIQIPIFYTFDINQNRCKINYLKTIDNYFASYSFLYNEDVIYANQSNISFLRGKVYAINQSGNFLDMDDLTLCSDIITEHNEISLNVELEIGSLYDKEYVWLKYIPEETQRYYLLCYGDENVKIDIFDYKTKSFVDLNRLYSFTDGYTNIHDSSIVGCYANVVLQEGMTYYFRISGVNYCETNDLIFVISENPRNDAVHIHDYTSHIWINSTIHISYCECGESITCGHAILNNNSYCLLCGGRADMGFVGPFS